VLADGRFLGLALHVFRRVLHGWGHGASGLRASPAWAACVDSSLASRWNG
jgi:hypothetical protein